MTGTNIWIETPTISATKRPRGVLANTYPMVSSPGDRGGIKVSTMHRIIFSNISEKEALAKLLFISAIKVRPGTKKFEKDILGADRPSPSKARLKIARNKRAVITGAMNVCI